ncbi:hypothetical protein OOT46_01000 [Aquabacterium sp. A7-Y]|uniref:HD domain-containing protein n=1 Tax=Aquabacterium sp. A7-Y TaxID=1349605 RepID=UPI00223CEF32|nr:hypothetical protein [Aquabacterium sp. A7-Y]MCW7536432.1 hypothetical protein [Aquabacterium sp. A7-Y]
MRLLPEHRQELLADWQRLCERLGLAGRACTGVGESLVSAWSRWPRRYHDANHLLACIRHWREFAPRCEDPDAVALALWFHDAVYWPWSKQNERRSADWACRFIRHAGLPEERARELADKVDALIMATQHHSGPPAGDAAWVVDIDLAILGQPPEVYDLFEAGVRSEYRWVPAAAYADGRGRVLQSFLDRPHIYTTEPFRQRYEQAARANMERALTRLQAAPAG